MLKKALQPRSPRIRKRLLSSAQLLWHIARENGGKFHTPQEEKGGALPAKNIATRKKYNSMDDNFWIF